jgi:putative flippase GtrA
MDSKERIYLKQFIKFNYVGVLTVLLGTAVFMTMTAMGFHYFMSLVGDYAAGILFSYFMNKRYTFKVETIGDLVPLIKTISMYVASFSLNVLLLKVCADIYGFNLIYSQFVIIFVLAMFNFLVFKLIIFRVVDERKIS